MMSSRGGWTHCKAENRWKRGYHAAKRLQLGKQYQTHQSELQTRTAFDGMDLSDKEKKRILNERKATFMGSLSKGIGKDDESSHKELGYQSKALEQQHWWVGCDGCADGRLEMIDWKVGSCMIGLMAASVRE